MWWQGIYSSLSRMNNYCVMCHRINNTYPAIRTLNYPRQHTQLELLNRRPPSSSPREILAAKSRSSLSDWELTCAEGEIVSLIVPLRIRWGAVYCITKDQNRPYYLASFWLHVPNEVLNRRKSSTSGAFWFNNQKAPDDHTPMLVRSILLHPQLGSFPFQFGLPCT